MPAAFDWLGVGDVALERPDDRSPTRALGGAAPQGEADLLWAANARMTRRVLEPALSGAQWVGLTSADAAVLFGPRVTGREAVAAIGRLGPVLVYLARDDGGVELLDGDRVL